MILTLRSAAGELLPVGLRRSPVYARALGRAAAVIQRRGIGLDAARQAHEEGVQGAALGPLRLAAAEAWREAECVALQTLDELGAPPARGTRLATCSA